MKQKQTHIENTPVVTYRVRGGDHLMHILYTECINNKVLPWWLRP